MTHWTRTRPTVPGWYWWRRPNHQADLGRVFGPSQGLLFELFHDGDGPSAVSNCWEDTEWAGPLLPPADGEWSSEAMEVPVNKE